MSNARYLPLKQWRIPFFFYIPVRDLPIYAFAYFTVIIILFSNIRKCVYQGKILSLLSYWGEEQYDSKGCRCKAIWTALRPEGNPPEWTCDAFWSHAIYCVQYAWPRSSESFYHNHQETLWWPWNHTWEIFLLSTVWRIGTGITINKNRWQLALCKAISGFVVIQGSYKWCSSGVAIGTKCKILFCYRHYFTFSKICRGK